MRSSVVWIDRILIRVWLVWISYADRIEYLESEAREKHNPKRASQIDTEALSPNPNPLKCIDEETKANGHRGKTRRKHRSACAWWEMNANAACS